MKRRDFVTGLGAGGAMGVATASASTGPIDSPVSGNGFVTMRPRRDADSRVENRFHVLDPFGNEIDQTGTKSQGLQEAINYCAEHGYGLSVIGGANTSSGEPWHMNLTASETIEIPPMRFWTWTMRGMTVNGRMAGDFMHFDSLVNSHIEWTGTQLVYMGNQAAVHFHPRNTPPTDPTLGIGVNWINMPNTVAVYGDGACCVRFSPADLHGPIFGNKMLFGELNGGASDTKEGTKDTVGIEVVSARGTPMFGSNQIDVFAAHGFGGASFRIGTEPYVDSIKGNFWRLQSTTVPYQTVLSSYETGGLYDIYFENSGLEGTVGVRLESIANNNRIRGYNNCPTPREEVGAEAGDENAANDRNNIFS